jgi:uncharacterized membrane protein
MKIDLTSFVFAIVLLIFSPLMTFVLRKWCGFGFGWAALCGIPFAFGLFFVILWLVGKIKNK